MVLDFAKEAIDSMNESWVEAESIKAWGQYNNYSNRKKACTVTRDDVLKNCYELSAQDLIEGCE